MISHNPETGVVFISGGKWTTYREMASDLIDKVLAVTKAGENHGSSLKACSTLKIPLNGREGYSSNLPIRLAQEYGVSKAVAGRLSTAYGGHAPEVCRIAAEDPRKKLGEPLIPGHPYIRGINCSSWTSFPR